MPRCKSLKSIYVDAVLFISLFALVGHISVNFWERFVIRSELSTVKTSLYSLKETIQKIGDAYDILLKDLNKLVDKGRYDTGGYKQLTNPVSKLNKNDVYRHEVITNNHDIHTRAFHNLGVKDTKPRNDTKGTRARNNTNLNKVPVHSQTTEKSNKYIYCKDASTSTMSKNSPKHTVAGSQCTCKIAKEYPKSDNCRYKSKPFNYYVKKCERDCDKCNNW